jgi:hypothetical protein
LGLFGWLGYLFEVRWLVGAENLVTSFRGGGRAVRTLRRLGKPMGRGPGEQPGDDGVEGVVTESAYPLVICEVQPWPSADQRIHQLAQSFVMSAALVPVVRQSP